MSSASATVNTRPVWYKSPVVRTAVVIIAIVIVVIAMGFMLSQRPQVSTAPVVPPATIDTPSAPVIDQPSEPEIPNTTTVAGEPGTGRNRAIELGEMCPTMNASLASMLVTGSFESYKFQLPLKCGGYQTALVDPGTVDIPSAPSDPLDTGNCPNDSTPTLDAETDMWVCVISGTGDTNV